MDVVVMLALLVLGAVFLVSLVILVIMCYRRRMSKEVDKSSPLRFSKLVENADNIENLGQLSPLIGELLDKNVWMYDASGLMQHCVAMLRLCRTLTDKLATVQLTSAPTPISEAICMATRNIFPRFDDLLDVVASSTVDVRVLEARAMSLGTVCWALYLPFTLLNPKYKEYLYESLNEINLHLITIRTAVKLAIAADKGNDENLSLGDVKSHLIEIRKNIRDQTVYEEDEDAEIDEPTTSGDSSEKTPLVMAAMSIAEEKLSEKKDRPSFPPIEMQEMQQRISLLDRGQSDDNETTRKMCNGTTIIEGLPPPSEEIHDDSVGGSSSSSTSSECTSSSASSHPIDPKA